MTAIFFVQITKSTPLKQRRSLTKICNLQVSLITTPTKFQSMKLLNRKPRGFLRRMIINLTLFVREARTSTAPRSSFTKSRKIYYIIENYHHAQLPRCILHAFKLEITHKGPRQRILRTNMTK